MCLLMAKPLLPELFTKHDHSAWQGYHNADQCFMLADRPCCKTGHLAASLATGCLNSSSLTLLLNVALSLFSFIVMTFSV